MAVFSFKVDAQCMHRDLSKRFDYKITKTRKTDANGYGWDAKITIDIYNKSDGKLFQTISYKPENTFESTFKDCNNERSYITGKNEKAEIADNDYGDIVIADLNFDGKEDIAVKYNLPADIGPEYWYFVQTDKGFKKDEYLSENMPFFPELIKPERHLLVSYVQPTAGTTIRQFRYNTTTKKWRKIGDRFYYHGIGDGEAIARLEKGTGRDIPKRKKQYEKNAKRM